MLEGKIDIEALRKTIKTEEKEPTWQATKFIPAAAPDPAAHYFNTVRRITILYALRSHLRGRLHMTKREVVVGPCEPNGRAIYPVTMEDQEKLIAQVWEEFRLAEESEAA